MVEDIGTNRAHDSLMSAFISNSGERKTNTSYGDRAVIHCDSFLRVIEQLTARIRAAAVCCVEKEIVRNK